ncbi:MAG TPA: ABC transporter substrate-binding protein [Rectinema sp.]|nr:ABC transporter substrate-binding protein [Rectinema sp.]
MRRIAGIFLSLFLVFFPLFGLQRTYSQQASAQSTSSQQATSLQTSAQHASFSIEQKNGYKLLKAYNLWPGASSTKTYVLYPRGSKAPRDVTADLAIAVPVRRVVLYSTTYIPAIEAIGELDAVVGVDNAAYIYNSALRTQIATGKTIETSKNWMPDIERLIMLKPDIIFNYGIGNEWDTFPKMQEAGLPVVLIGDWNEQDPIARAQWAVFIAAFFDKENIAQERLDAITKAYESLRSLALSASKRPKVLVNGPFQGIWSVSGGQSYMARLIKDASGDYLWADNKDTGALNLSVEAVFERALKADVWLNPVSGAKQLSDVRAMDPRFSALPILQKGQVWNNDLRCSPEGGNDYFESAVMNPHLVLSDLIAIFHPELMPNYKFNYYKKLNE